MNKKQPDPRIQRSKTLLRQALVELMQHKSAHTITIRELTEQAQINRSTFYLHYQDMPDFIQQTIKDVVDGLIAFVEPQPHQVSLNNISERSYYTKYFGFIQQHRDFFLAALGDNGLPEFRHKLMQGGIAKYMETMAPYKKEIEKVTTIPILAQYIVSAHVGLVEYWLQDGMQYSAAYMANQVRLLSIDGVFSNVADLKDNLNIPV